LSDDARRVDSPKMSRARVVDMSSQLATAAPQPGDRAPNSSDRDRHASRRAPVVVRGTRRRTDRPAQRAPRVCAQAQARAALLALHAVLSAAHVRVDPDCRGQVARLRASAARSRLNHVDRRHLREVAPAGRQGSGRQSR
jgi:hypothetical protein